MSEEARDQDRQLDTAASEWTITPIDDVSFYLLDKVTVALGQYGLENGMIGRIEFDGADSYVLTCIFPPARLSKNGDDNGRRAR